MPGEASNSDADIAMSASERLGEFTRTITLTSIDKAPKDLKLQSSKCLPCLEVGSRCDGHDNYTQACIQCGKRQVECTWQLEQRAQYNWRRRAERKRQQREPSDRDSIDIAHNAGTTSAKPSDAESTISTHRKHKTTRSAALERQKQTVIPFAGWLPLRTDSRPQSSKGSKGKGRAISVDSKAEQKRARQQTAASDSDREPDAISADKAVAQMKRYYRGRNFLTVQDYTTLLASQYAEESTDLARHLHWWEFSSQAADIRDRWKHIYSMSAEEVAKLPYLDVLLAENAHSWTLWPRLSHTQQIPIDPGASVLLQPALDLEDALRDAVLRALQGSGTTQKALEEMTDIHLDAYMQDAYEYGTHESSERDKNAQNLYLTRDDFRKRYLNHDELLLDHAEIKEKHIVPIVAYTLQLVLLRLAELRKPLGPRLDAGWHPKQKMHNDQIDKEIDKAVQLAPEPAFGPLLDVDDVEVQPDAEVDVLSLVAEQFAESTEMNAADNAPEIKLKRKKRLREEHQEPADWKAALLAAVTIPGMSRTAFCKAVSRMEGLYGQSGIDFMKRFDAIHPKPISGEERQASMHAKFNRNPTVVANESILDTLTPPISIPRPRQLGIHEQPYPIGVRHSDRVERSVLVRRGNLPADSQMSSGDSTA